MVNVQPLRRRFFDSLYSSYLVQGLTSGANILVKLGLAWLLLPADFGLFAVALFVLSVVNMVRDGGLDTQAIRDREPAYGSIFWFHAAGGLLLWGMVWLGAEWAAALNPHLPDVLRLFSPIVILSALSTVPLLHLNRTLQLKMTVLPRMAQLAAFCVLAVTLAHAGYGVAALVVAKVVSEAVLLCVLWLRPRPQDSFRFDWGELRRMLWQAKLLYLLGLIEVIAVDIDKGILSRYCSETEVGLYFMAWSVVFFLSKVIEPSVMRVLFPAFSRLRDDPVRANRLYTWGTMAIIGLEVPVYFALAANAGAVVTLLFPAVWAGMTAIIIALAFLPVIDPFSMLGVEVLRSREEDAAIFLPSAGCLLILLFAGSYLTQRWGGVGMALANYVAHLLSVVVILRVRRLLPCGFRHLLRRLPAVYLSGAMATLAASLMPAATPGGRLGWAVAGVVAAWGVTGALYFRDWRAVLRLERD